MTTMGFQIPRDDPVEQAVGDVTRFLAGADGLRRVVEVALREGVHPAGGADGHDDAGRVLDAS
jgi:hypothetical protein